MKSSICALLATASWAAVAAGQLAHNRFYLTVPKPNPTFTDTITEGSFEQLIDHSNPSLGTFSQRYWYDAQYWKGSGSPIVLFTPGEEDATGYLGYCTNVTLTGAVAQKIGGAAIVLEHRYWGTSSPFDVLTTANMTYLNLENNIQDLIHFAKTVKLPFAKGAPSNAQSVPWVLMGGSYSGALTAWTYSKAPGTFWAYLATSAPVQSIGNYWQYFPPIQQGMAKNCSTDVTKVIDYMDGVMMNGTLDEINALKEKFGLAGVTHNTDFMSALQNGPWLWQAQANYYQSGFFEWCDYVENAENITNPSQLPGPNGVGLQKALNGYAAWMKQKFIPGYCETLGFKGTDNVECFETYNPNNSMFTDMTLGNPINRQWNWMLCNQPLGYWQDGAPLGVPTIVSRLVDAAYWVRQCGLFFPKGPQGQSYGLAEGLTYAETNEYTGGWEITNTTRFIYTNGQYDPWRSGTVSSEYRPGGPLKSTAERPVFLIPKGHHCYDLIIENGVGDPALAAIQKAEIDQLATWVSEYSPQGYYPD